MEKIRKHFIFYGRVQGVGFRYRAYHAATSLGVGGWVKNLSDGTVEMETEGYEESIDKMIMAIENSHYIVIENLSVKSVKPIGERYFRIID